MILYAMILRVRVEQVSDQGNGSYVDFGQGQVSLNDLGRELQTTPLIFRSADVGTDSVGVTLHKSVLGERVSRSRESVRTNLPDGMRQFTLYDPGDYVAARVGSYRYTFEAVDEG